MQIGVGYGIKVGDFYGIADGRSKKMALGFLEFLCCLFWLYLVVIKYLQINKHRSASSLNSQKKPTYLVMTLMFVVGCLA